jgi:plasmid maintenance system antidote protein VapI
MANKKKQPGKLTDEELAEAYIFPADKSIVSEAEELAFWAMRKKRLRERSPEQQILANILQLKFQLEDYIQHSDYDDKHNFGFFLKSYIDILGKKNKDFAEEIDITSAELSQLVNSHRNPSKEILVRLELHSDNNIPAIAWYRLLEKEQTHLLAVDQELRKAEAKHVKKRAFSS